MKKLLVVLCILSLAGTAMASNRPQITVGGPGNPIMNGPRDNTCQYGFIDTAIGSGWTWGLGQQLGIQCTGPMLITGVGCYSEFIVQAGNVDVNVNGNNIAVVQPVAGNNQWTINPPYQVGAGPVCVMLCPEGNFWGVTGEDYNSPPYGNSYWSSSCACSNAFTDNNLTIWVNYTNSVPTQSTSWGRIQAMYR
ncbi:MAG TPA: hypothetical protein VFH83_07095 [Spirochaetia bacterium]|nr:hypothetical protein [Spirochaetia bacterium]